MSTTTSSSLRLARLEFGLMLLVLLAALWAVIILHLAKAKDDALAEGERELHSLTRAFAEQVTATVRTIDLSLMHLREDWGDGPATFAAEVDRQQDYLGPEMTHQVAVIDARGWLVYTSLDPHPKPLDLGDREHFRVQVGAGDRLFISKPVLGRVSGKWSIQFTRPLHDGAGKFAGVAVLSIAPDYFSRFRDTVSLGPQSTVALVRDGGDLLARSPSPELGLGKVLAGVPYLAAGAAASGSFRRVAQVDGVERLYTWRRIPEYGLTAVIGETPLALLAAYERERTTYLVGGGALSLLLALLALGMMRGLEQRSRAAAELEASEARCRTLVSALAEGVLLVDGEGVVLAANAAAEAAFAAAGADPVGCRLLAADLAMTDGEGHPLSPAELPLVAVLHGGPACVGMVVGLPALPGGPRWFRASASPLPGGVGGAAAVVSFHDVTAERSAQEGQRLAMAVIESAAEGVLVTDVAGVVKMVNPAFSTITGYRPEEFIGATPGLLRSGRHGPEFYQAMWQAIDRDGVWQGEIWNRRKNGDIYPQWLTISAVHDARGQASHYVGVFSDISERIQRERRIWRQANFDSLTELPNRSHFNERLELATAEARRSGTPLALLFIDLDHFKWVNDTHGHEAGNQLLREAARRMAGCLRAEDSVGRLSGDEFAILLPNLARADDADLVARKVLDTLASPYRIEDSEVVVTASIGIAIFPGDGNDAASLLKNSDAAMYRGKESGRNSIAYFTPALHARAEQRLRLTSELRQALAADQFVLHYQPVMRADASLFGAEALLRWRHPERGLVAPTEFITLAEEAGIVAGITTWVLPAALAQLRAWRQDHGFAGSLAVNLSSVEFRNRQHLAALLATIAEAAPDPGSLTIEITESSLLDGDDAVLPFLEAVRRLGARVALDDFGTGYSSLAYLSRYPFDLVKIDRQFVARIPGSEHDLALVEAIVALAGRLHLQVVAEGVETLAQRDCLVGLGCELLQGFLYAQALPAEEFRERFLG